MIARASLLLAAALFTASCSGPKPLVVLPTGPGAPATDGREVLEEATNVCSQAHTFSAEVSLSGTVAGQRVRGRLLAGFAEPHSAYLEAPAPFGASAFIFATTGDNATLLLPRERRALARGGAVDVLEAITGIAIRPQHFGPLLLGCASMADGPAAEEIGPHWRVFASSHRVYARRLGIGEPWRLVTVVHTEGDGRGWRADYGEFSPDLPKRIHLVSEVTGRFDLQLTISQLEMNVSLGDEVFQPAVPSTFAPVTIGQLRDAGPLAELSAR